MLTLLPGPPGSAGIDKIYDALDHLAEHDLAECDSVLAAMSPESFHAETIVSVLIGTLPVKGSLPSRPGFITRASPVLALEPEGLAALLDGLE